MKYSSRFAIFVAACFCPFSVLYSQTNTFPQVGNVGIGTTTPAELLHITTGNNLTSRVLIGDAASHTVLYPSYDSQVWSFLEISRNKYDNGNGSSALVLSSYFPSPVPTDSCGTMTFANRAISAGEKRTAMVSSRFDGSMDKGNLLFFTNNAGSLAERMRVSADGKIGIGTESPAELFHVTAGNNVNTRVLIGDASSHTVLYPSYDSQVWSFLEISRNKPDTGNGSAALVLSSYFPSPVPTDSCGTVTFANRAIGGSEKRTAMVSGLFDGASDKGVLQFLTNNSGSIAERMRITSDGKVGIGTSSPSHALTVNGPVRASQFIANVNTYADHVFAPEYQLQSLSEIEAAIKQDGHLPNIPSEAEVRDRGVDVAELTVKLLQKVEELTLHAIEHRKLIDKLSAENELLRKQLQTPNASN